MTSTHNEQQFQKIVADLSDEFASAYSADAVRACVDQVRAELEPPAKVTEYLPVLVRRYAREELVRVARERHLRPHRAAS